jgi:predicted DNA-binding protein with PD1-like motif
VEKSRKGGLLMVRLADGENLLSRLEDVLREEGITSGIIIGGVGMVKNAALSFYKGSGEYETFTLTGEAELCSISGNISTHDGELVIHAHVAVAKRGGEALGGHLSGADVHMTAEIAILEAEQKFTRKVDPQTGLKTLTLG